MDSRYTYSQTEDKIYELWEKADAFSPEGVAELREEMGLNQTTTKTFSIIMPPPNANDPLHVGHAMFVAIEDVLVRYHRMLGEKTVWIPGTDHAGIETQFVFEKKLKKDGKSRFNFDRSTLYQMIWDYVQENSGIAVEQIKKLGASADWSRFKFTLDKDIVNNVLKTFKSLHEDGLVYRDLQLVNYCTKCGTSYSELEVNHEDKTDALYTIQYGPLQVATVRPETIFGDVAVAVNPADERYQQYIGKTISVTFPWSKEPKKMPVIADEYVDKEFGTGVVKVTPYHDPNDFMMWQNHKTEISEKPVPVIGTNGKLINVPAEFNNLAVVNARKAVLDSYKKHADTTGENLIVNVNAKYNHSVSVCYRCGNNIEPLPLPQFFIKVNDPKKSLTKMALDSLDSEETKVYGAGREKILRHWLTNLKDWNISRQIVWGINIPVWYKVDGNEELIKVGLIDKDNKFISDTLENLLKDYSLDKIVKKIQNINVDFSVPYQVSIEKPNDGFDYIQETDTFDTWFSSGQWPVVTLKNNKPNDFENFYSTSVMNTGYDILPFWVMRMMLLGIYSTGKTPFKEVYLHGLVRDEKGQKMSKSKGNVINPILIKEEFGADALRMALVIRSTAGQDKSVGTQDIKAMRNLTNKIWNGARFILLQKQNPEIKSANSGKDDTQFITDLNQTIIDISSQLNDLKIGLACETAYNQFWHSYCDIYIEKAKVGDVSLDLMIKGLQVYLKLLHPFMPFVTEAVWQELYKEKIVTEKLLIVSDWPKQLI